MSKNKQPVVPLDVGRKVGHQCMHIIGSDNGVKRPTLKGQPLKWDAREPGAYDRTDVPEDIRQKYKYYYRDENGNECYIAKDWQPSLDAMSLYHFGMKFEELAQYVINKLYEQQKKEAL